MKKRRYKLYHRAKTNEEQRGRDNIYYQEYSVGDGVFKIFPELELELGSNLTDKEW
jgi:hypothetical protein